MTSFFPRFPSSEIAPFFRLLDTADPFLQLRTSSRSFVPRFDVREINSAYELHGELPGLKQEDIEIEFVDANTLVIRGKAERQSTQTSDKGKSIEQSTVTETVAADTASEHSSSSYQKATVEDDYVDAGAAAEGSEAAETKSTASAEATPAPSTPAVNNTGPDYKYWVSERSVGQFERRFSFPGRVNQEAVKASLANGILSIIVPKSIREEKKITIE